MQLRGGLAAVEEAFTPERRDLGPRLQAVIAANPELQERLAFKRAGYAATMNAALQERGVPEAIASVASSLGVLAFSQAYQRWSDPECDLGFAAVASATLDELAAATVALTSDGVALTGARPATRSPKRPRRSSPKARQR